MLSIGSISAPKTEETQLNFKHGSHWSYSRCWPALFPVQQQGVQDAAQGKAGCERPAFLDHPQIPARAISTGKSSACEHTAVQGSLAL